MVKPVNSDLYLDGELVKVKAQLVDIYQRRIEKFGMGGKTMFYLDEIQHQLKIAQFASLLHDLVNSGDSLLDIGCGYGSLAPLLPNCHYLGIDLVPEFINHAKQRHHLLEFKLLDLEDCQDSYDWCVLVGVVNSIPQPDKVVKLAWDRCQKGLLVDFIDKVKFDGLHHDQLNCFDLGDCLTNMLALGAQKVEIYPTTNVWTIFVATKSGKWLRSRS